MNVDFFSTKKFDYSEACSSFEPDVIIALDE